MEHNDETASKAEFARLRGVTPDCVSRWLRNGKISDKAIVGVGRNARIRVDIATKMVERRRQRFDDDTASVALLDARTRTAVAHAELQEMRVARERGLWMPKAEFQEAVGDVLRAVKQAHLNAVYGVEEICGAYQSNGLPAAAGRMRAQMTELLNSIADMLAAAEAKFEPPEGDGDGG
jgi:hypothetical protein